MAAIDFRPAAPNTRVSFSNLLGRLAEWNDRRATRNALLSLSSRELDDIGLTRSDIDRIANGDLIR